MDQNPPSLNPLGVDADRVRRDEEHRLRVEVEIGKARKAEEWFDIYVSIVEHGVKTTAEQHGDGPAALEKLRDQRPLFADLRHILQYQGLPLTEHMEWEGPDYHLDDHGFYLGISWPRGEWLRVTWPDRDKVEFKGQRALIMATFLLWWQQFADLATAQENLLNGKAAPRRLIEPGSMEWNRYFTEKAAAQAAQEKARREGTGQ